MSFLQTEYLSKLLESHFMNSQSTFNFETICSVLILDDFSLHRFHSADLFSLKFKWVLDFKSTELIEIQMKQRCQFFNNFISVKINANICFPHSKIQRTDQHIFPFLAKYFGRGEASEMFILYRVS